MLFACLMSTPLLRITLCSSKLEININFHHVGKIRNSRRIANVETQRKVCHVVRFAMTVD